MTRIIAILNEKGGTAKTTTAVNVGHALARAGKKTLLVDLDPQGNATQHLGVEFETSTYHLLTDAAPLEKCLRKARENLDILPSNKNLFAAELHMNSQAGRELILRNKLDAILDKYEFILVDCAPSLSVLSHNALALCREALVPVSMDYLSLAGLSSVERTINTIKRALNHEVTITGIIPTLFDGRVSASHDILATLEKEWPGLVLPTIRVNSKLREAPKHKKTIFEHAPESRGADDYTKLAQHIINMEAESHGKENTQ